MKRRDFVICAVATIASSVLGANTFAEGAAGSVEYTPQAFEAAQASGKPLMLDFFAPW